MRVALVTGASSGIGREFARLADGSGRYDQIWAVARRRDRLEQLAAECSTEVRPFALDLTLPRSVDALGQALSRERERLAAAGDDLTVGLLVNAAGFARLGTFDSVSREDRDAMIDLNCRALTDLTAACVPFMTRGSRIIEVASMAGFLPLPHLNVYAATKAYVVSYTRSLRWELAGSGIHATALCPQWARTEFERVSRETARPQDVRHQWPSVSPRRVARWTMAVNACNLPVATCGLYAFVVRLAAKIIPNPVLMAFWELFRRL